MAWDLAFDQRQQRLVAAVCDGSRPADDRDQAWRSLVGEVAPHIERWARTGRTLRRCGLDGEDDARAVMVAVLERLARRDFENLRGFLARRPAPAEAGAEADEAGVIEELGRLVRPGEAEATAAAADAEEDDRQGTPLRAWLISLTRFVAKDHVKARLGWSSTVRGRFELEAAPVAEAVLAAVRALEGVAEAIAGGAALEVEWVPGRCTAAAIAAAVVAAGAQVVSLPQPGGSKRDLTTDAERWQERHEPVGRPPITDSLAMRRILGEIRAYMGSLPAQMHQALELWLAEHDFDEIAARLGLDGAERARSLVRAAQARLRARFRDRWPELCAG